MARPDAPRPSSAVSATFTLSSSTAVLLLLLLCFDAPSASALPFRPNRCCRNGRTVVKSDIVSRWRRPFSVRGGEGSSSATETSTTRISSDGNETTTTRTTRRRYRVLQVHIVHRHGDRTPITPLVNETYWSAQLPHPEVLEKIAEGTTLVREEGGERASHAAGGRGPFGQLTNLGLMQMVELGSRLREELHLDDPSDDGDGKGANSNGGDGGILHRIDEDGHEHVHSGRLFTPADPIHPSRIRVTSTDFPRTVQSVRALLVGLFPDGFDPDDPDDRIEIDVRHTSRLIPDPQPRRSEEQMQLERELAKRPHLDEREEEMRDLARRTTEALRGVLGRGHDDISFGVGEERTEGGGGGGKVCPSGAAVRPLPWVQLAEITKCLEVRDLLPPSVSREDTAKIASHAAWRWFEALRHPRLIRMAMGEMAGELVDTFHRGLRWSRRHLPYHGGLGDESAANSDNHPPAEEEPALHIYSAHDSTLIGLLCAFRLESPDSWPEYGSYIKMELIEAETVEDDETVTVRDRSSVEPGDKDGDGKTSSTPSHSDPVRHYVRFSLNGEVLRCYWGIDEDGRWTPTELMPLEHLTAMVRREQRRTHRDEHEGDDPFVPSVNEETR